MNVHNKATMCKHKPVEIFPRQRDLPENSSQEEKINLFLKMWGQPTDWVICTECRKVGHYIKSRRGGIRWHQHQSDYTENVIAKALECWQTVGKPVPFAPNGQRWAAPRDAKALDEFRGQVYEYDLAFSLLKADDYGRHIRLISRNF